MCVENSVLVFILFQVASQVLKSYKYFLKKVCLSHRFISIIMTMHEPTTFVHSRVWLCEPGLCMNTHLLAATHANVYFM